MHRERILRLLMKKKSSVKYFFLLEHYLQGNMTFILTIIHWYWGLEQLEFRQKCRKEISE